MRCFTSLSLFKSGSFTSSITCNYNKNCILDARSEYANSFTNRWSLSSLPLMLV
jgi:hypothetical protein